MKHDQLSQAMMMAGLTSLAAPAFAKQLPQVAPKRRTTSMNYALQKEVFEAAEAKRQRRAARNLANAGMPQGDLL